MSAHSMELNNAYFLNLLTEFFITNIVHALTLFFNISLHSKWSVSQLMFFWIMLQLPSSFILELRMLEIARMAKTTNPCLTFSWCRSPTSYNRSSKLGLVPVSLPLPGRRADFSGTLRYRKVDSTLNLVRNLYHVLI